MSLSSARLFPLLLMLTLFASYVCSSMAMRYFNHAGFVMSMPAQSEQRRPLDPMAQDYVGGAGLLYSWGLRCFLMIAPLVAGIVNPLLMPVLTVGLVFVLWLFDRPARSVESPARVVFARPLDEQGLGVIPGSA